MTSYGHRLTGVAAGIIAGAIANFYGGWGLAALVAASIGGTAPDDLEIWRSVKNKGIVTGKVPIIKHRTLTHVILIWISLALWSGVNLGGALYWDLLFGYSMGGLMHLIVDFPNPMGVPVINPYTRYSLNWWKSGQYETLIIILMFLISISFANALGWSPL